MNTHSRFTKVSLIGRLAEGVNDQRAWQEFFDLYGPHVLEWSRKFGCPRSDEQDVLQNVMIKLIKAFETFRYDPNQRFRSWLKTVTRSAVMDMFRSPAFQTRASGGEAVWDALQSQEAREDLEATIERVFDMELWEMGRREVREEVEAKTWLAFQRTELERCTPDEAAKELGLSVGSVYAARSRIKKRLEVVLNRIRKELDGEDA